MVRLAWLLVVLLAIAGCGGDSGDSGSSGDKATATPNAERTAAAGETGTGYRFDVPEGWSDRTKDFSGTAVKVDRAFVGPRKGKFATNVVVIREVPTSRLTLDQVIEQFKDQASSLADDKGISAIEDRELGGEKAKTYTYILRREAPPKVRQRQVVAVVDDAVYTITFSVADAAFADDEQIFNDLLASWRWS